MTHSRPFVREELAETCRDLIEMLNGVPNISADRQKAHLHALLHMLEDYPLKQVAESAVNVLFADLATRKGFAEVIDTVGDRDQLRKFWVELVGRTIVYKPTEIQSTPSPAPTPPKQTVIDLE